MAETICRTLRDGGLEGEHAPALTIKDTLDSPFGLHVFAHVLSQLSSSVLAGKSQSRGIVVVSFSRNPSFYADLLRRRGADVSSPNKWLRILDCYTDPLGWKARLRGPESLADVSEEASPCSGFARVCNNVWDMDKLYSLILELGKELVGQGKVRFSVAIDSVNQMLQHASTSTVASLLTKLRSHDQISSIFWSLHSDLHEVRVTSSLEYISSMVASVEPLNISANGLEGDLETLSLSDSFGEGKFHVRLKRRNGRVRIMCEEFRIEQSGVNFTSISSQEGTVKGSVPKVQFNLELSEKERIERAKVILPFEHQGNGKPIQIYDGRRSLAENSGDETSAAQVVNSERKESSEGEIIYYRDSDDEMPDSDEDPDDDLDI